MGVQKLTILAEKQEKLLEKVVESTMQTTKVLDKLSKQSIEMSKESFAVQTKMVEKLDKNYQKFFTLFDQLEKDREAGNVKFDKMMDKID